MLRLRPRLMPRWRLLLVLNGFAATMLLASILKISTQISFREGCRGLGDVTRFPGAQRSWNRGDSQGHPAIALLLSFPNSGTSYTLRLVRSSSLTSTATNYAKETKEARSYIQGRVNETIPTAVYGNERYGTSKNTCPMLHDSSLPRPKEFILTKTHCAGYANMGQSQNSSTSIVVSPREFLMGCVTPFRLANHSNQRNQSSVDKKRKQIKDCPYSPSLVQKAVHIMRSPLDNVVSRYHLWKKNFGTNSSRPGIFNKSASSGVESVSSEKEKI